ncbi:bactofilin family protein [Terriglobus tenax]|uniref:hypothetical protein n=1 Tax=Terriglobus tenax TaxID=1111115 RepID=UPI0021E06CCE|nr:hypothetical protein [Terriglobus tenax]
MHRLMMFAVVLLLSCFSAGDAFADSREDHVGVGNHVVVGEDETADDIVCLFCDVTVHGRVTGDIVMAFGSLHVDEDKSIGGDVVAFGTPIKLKKKASVGGDLVTFGGSYEETAATVHGDRVISPSPLWILVPLAPFLFIGGLIWLLVHTIRNRTPMPPPYPGRYHRM